MIDADNSAVILVLSYHTVSTSTRKLASAKIVSPWKNNTPDDSCTSIHCTFRRNKQILRV